MISLLIFGCLDFIIIASNLLPASMSYTVETISTHISDLGEGPFWDQKSRSLYHVDAFVGDVCKLNVADGEEECYNLKDLTTIVIPFKSNDDLLLVSLRNKVIKLDWKTKNYEVIAELSPELKGKERFNDGKIDAKGRLWIGSVLDSDSGVVKEGGSLYRLDNNQFTKMSDKFTLSNGMAWSNDNTKMYFNDSEDQKIYVFDFDLEKGTISNKKILISFPGNLYFESTEYPDGMTIDNDGKLWVVLYGGGRVVQIDPNTGRVENSVSVPAPHSTSVTFAGDSYDKLYVTTGSGSLNAEQKAKFSNAGKVFQITGDGIQGKASQRFGP